MCILINIQNYILYYKFYLKTVFVTELLSLCLKKNVFLILVQLDDITRSPNLNDWLVSDWIAVKSKKRLLPYLYKHFSEVFQILIGKCFLNTKSNFPTIEMWITHSFSSETGPGLCSRIFMYTWVDFHCASFVENWHKQL